MLGWNECFGTYLSTRATYRLRGISSPANSGTKTNTKNWQGYRVKACTIREWLPNRATLSVLSSIPCCECLLSGVEWNSTLRAACTLIDKVMSIKRAIQIGGLALGDCTVGTAWGSVSRNGLYCRQKVWTCIVFVCLYFTDVFVLLCRVVTLTTNAVQLLYCTVSLAMTVYKILIVWVAEIGK